MRPKVHPGRLPSRQPQFDKNLQERQQVAPPMQTHRFPSIRIRKASNCAHEYNSLKRDCRPIPFRLFHSAGSFTLADISHVSSEIQ
ncbi:hypothetical protein TKWG_03125 [Advenella kashmirensis WT001]|uniref:Uncharacterized protein n=1 Tax=Advenella kashmirensis (strain DSM 17095 / LMG 22695 / WT001) TaxID=1036672 RepID=I3U883_ADVKW|nr:hypothetical protein TKWG_03125 [Advenella kashmirensis WT001]